MADELTPEQLAKLESYLGTGGYGFSGNLNLTGMTTPTIDLSRANEFTPPPKAPEPVDPVDTVAKQLANQRKNLNTDKYWTGGARGYFGDVSAWDRQMAADLVSRGITNIDQIVEKSDPVYGPATSYDVSQAKSNFRDFYYNQGNSGARPGQEVTYNGKRYVYDVTSEFAGSNWEGSPEYTQTPILVPLEQTGVNKTIINKVTGEPLARPAYQHEYASPSPQSDGSYVWSGTYAGDGNTAYRIQFTPDGLPVFYTSGHSSSDFSPQDLAGIGMVASFAFPGIGQAIGSTILGGLGVAASPAIAGLVGNVVMQTVFSGGDVENAIKNAGASYIGAEVAGAIGAGASDFVTSKAGQDFLQTVTASATRAAILGQDVEQAALSAALGKAVNIVADKIPGFGGMDSATKASITSAVQTVMNGPGSIADKLPNALTNGALTYGLSQVDGFKNMDRMQQAVVTAALQAGLQGKDITEASLKAAINSAQQAVRTSASNVGKTDMSNEQLDAALGKAYQEAGVGSIADAVSRGVPVTEVLTKVEETASPEVLDAIHTAVGPPSDTGMMGPDLTGVEIPASGDLFGGLGGRGRGEAPVDYFPGVEEPDLFPEDIFGPSPEVIGLGPDLSGVGLPGIVDPTGTLSGRKEEPVNYFPGVEEPSSEPPVPGSTGEPMSIKGADGSILNFDAAGKLISVVDPEGVLHDWQELFGYGTEQPVEETEVETQPDTQVATQSETQPTEQDVTTFFTEEDTSTDFLTEILPTEPASETTAPTTGESTVESESETASETAVETQVETASEIASEIASESAVEIASDTALESTSETAVETATVVDTGSESFTEDITATFTDYDTDTSFLTDIFTELKTDVETEVATEVASVTEEVDTASFTEEQTDTLTNVLSVTEEPTSSETEIASETQETELATPTSYYSELDQIFARTRGWPDMETYVEFDADMNRYLDYLAKQAEIDQEPETQTFVQPTEVDTYQTEVDTSETFSTGVETTIDTFETEAPTEEATSTGYDTGVLTNIFTDVETEEETPTELTEVDTYQTEVDTYQTEVDTYQTESDTYPTELETFTGVETATELATETVDATATFTDYDTDTGFLTDILTDLETSVDTFATDTFTELDTEIDTELDTELDTDLDTINLSTILETETETATETATQTATPTIISQPTTAPPTTPPPKRFTPLPPGLTSDQIFNLLNMMGTPTTFQPYELPYYFQLPEEPEDAFDITQAFSPTLYKLRKE